MKKSEIKTGEVYSAKVSGSIVPVRIDRENPRGGWDATNMKTKKAVRVKSAQRLRGKAATWPGKPKARATDGVAKTVAAVEKGDLTKGATVPTGAKKATKTTKDAKPATKRDTGKRAAKGGEPDGKPMSLLDAAAHLLSLGTGDPMRCKDIVDLAVARELWTPGNGKTPSNTLYASILREIKTKGDASRFVKSERGKFALASKS